MCVAPLPDHAYFLVHLGLFWGFHSGEMSSLRALGTSLPSTKVPGWEWGESLAKSHICLMCLNMSLIGVSYVSKKVWE